MPEYSPEGCAGQAEGAPPRRREEPERWPGAGVGRSGSGSALRGRDPQRFQDRAERVRQRPRAAGPPVDIDVDEAPERGGRIEDLLAQINKEKAAGQAAGPAPDEETDNDDDES